MMKLNKILSAATTLLLASTVVTACHDDEGNYTYAALDSVDIVTPGSDTEDGDIFTLDRGGHLYIDPEVKFNGQPVDDNTDAPLKYMWTFYAANTGMGVDYTIDTLATTRVLDVDINRTAGTYYAQLTVTNTNTGVESYYRATCNVEEAITAGWMMLYERADMPGYSDVGLVVNPFSKKNIQNNKEFWNLWSSSNGGSPLPGEPVGIMHETVPLPTGTPRIATTKTISVVSTANFAEVMNMNDMFYSLPQGGDIRWYGPCAKMGCCEGLLIDNDMRTLIGTMGTSNGYFGLPKRFEGGVGELAPWASSRTNGNAMMECVVYSQTNGAFYYTNTGIDYHPFMAQDPAAARFDVNNTGGAKLLFADWGVGFHDFLLFGIDDKRYVAETNFSASPNMPNLGLTWADVSQAPQIAEATSFATNFIGRYAYYGAGNKVYNVAYDNGRATEAWTAPDSNEKVVCISTHKYYFTTIQMAMLPNANSIVHIATWNESTRKGKLYEYRINPASGQIMTDDEHYEYEVPGKIHSMCWKYELAM